ncbi:hypothetical protein [Paenibacillus sp. HB172176]|uniref:hypothetical protein n=1 Tax=Paenibacillus sp. HB172176 TaxID=2493690 RepID=UPI00143A2A41|nr:hypothetical protein [Paenibacillus sp. HB172176]
MKIDCLIAWFWAEIMRLRPAPGIRVGRVAAVAEAFEAERGLALMKAILSTDSLNYQPYWELAGHLYKRLNRPALAQSAYSRAIGLSQDAAVRQFLSREVSGISKR